MNDISCVLEITTNTVIIVEPTYGCMGHDFRAYFRDGGSVGSGDSVSSAVMSLVNNMRRTADRIEDKLVEWESNQ